MYVSNDSLFKSIESMSGIPEYPEDLSAALLFLSFLAFFRLLLAFDFFLFFFSLLLLRSGLDDDEDEEDDDDIERLLFLLRFFCFFSSLNKLDLLSFVAVFAI